MIWMILAVPFVASGLCAAGAACRILNHEEQDEHTVPFVQIALAISGLFFVIAAKVAS